MMLRFASEQPMRIAIVVAGTHSHWTSRVLEECSHEVLVASWASPGKTGSLRWGL